VTNAEVLGIIILGSRTPREFPAAEVQLLQALANQLGVGLQKAQLYEETRQAYAELQASEARHARLAAILEATTDLVAIADAQGRRLYLNRAGYRLLGLAEDADVSQMRISDYRPAWAVQQRTTEILPTAAREGIWQGETAYLRSDGTEVPVSSVVIAHYGPDRQVEFYSTIARDVRDRNRLEAQLLQAQRLETAGRIAGQVAHDFNNLLAPLAGYPELIKLHLPPGHVAVEYCDRMLAAAQRIAEINDDLLTLGRRGYFEQHPADLNAVVQQALELVAAPNLGVQISTELANDLPLIWGSEAQLVRVVTNLLTNAHDAMPGGGRLAIRTRGLTLRQPRGTLSALVPGAYVSVEVADTGEGIPPELQDRIFDPFVTTKTTSQRRGAGLGLSVVRAVVEDHHGAIDFTSQPGSGTTFRLYFPATEAAQPGVTAPVAPGRGEVILVVDDDRGQRSVIEAMLQGLGYQVTQADSGETAVAHLTTHHADLVILDMLMPPGIDGAETYRRLQALHPGQPAIILSGYAESDRVEQARTAGVSAYLRKPISLVELARAVRDGLDQASTPH
jgi:PAS domain S-box-containing protein